MMSPPRMSRSSMMGLLGVVRSISVRRTDSPGRAACQRVWNRLMPRRSLDDVSPSGTLQTGESPDVAWCYPVPAMDRPPTRFAWNGAVSLAYQVCGAGASDLIYLQGYCSNVDMNWESPYLARFLRGLAAHARLIVTDRRGWGCSERFTPGHVPDVDTLTDDIIAVMKAARSERASIIATYESAIVASLFAATYPERTRALILIDPQITYLPTEETPWMP